MNSLFSTFILLVAGVISVQATTYYVDSSIAASGNGQSLNTAFKTISEAAAILNPGDICQIRKGTYYESVRPANSGTSESPITFRAYNDENVVILGGKKVSGTWVQYQPNIYSLTVSETVQDVFVNRRNMLWARFPNMRYDATYEYNLLRPTVSTLNRPTGVDWNNVIYWRPCPEQWYIDISRETVPVDNVKGIYIGVLGLLDTEGEWCQSGGKLYMWAPGGVNPGSMNVEIKTRNFTVDFSSRNYIYMIGITVFAGTINMDNATYCVVDGCKNLFVNSLDQIVGSASLSNGWLRNGTNASSWNAKGIAVGGNHNVVRNSEVGYAWSDGISMWGSDNTVENCHIHDVCLGGKDVAGVSACAGTRLTVRRNTIHGSGRSLLLHRNTTSLIFEYNELYDFCALTIDGGATYTWTGDGTGSSMCYNWIHDGLIPTFQTSGRPYGIYIDDHSQNFTIHHNVFWDLGAGIVLNTWAPSSRNHDVHNNTCWNVSEGSRTFDATQLFDTRLYNNLFSKGPVIGTDKQNNIVAPVNPGFIDSTNHDFRLASGSAAINAGRVISGITDGYIGSAPDVGAYEYGGRSWRAGQYSDTVYVNPPQFSPQAGEYVDSIAVQLTCATSGAQIYYTINGTEPSNVSGTLYTLPVILRASNNQVVIKARAYKTGMQPGAIASASFNIYPTQPATNGLTFESGIRYKYYEGTWTMLPDFSTLTPVRDSICSFFSVLQVSHRNDSFAVSYSGYIQIPVDGMYTFYVTSDDGTKLFIDNVQIINNDGMLGISGKSGKAALKAGMHPINVSYFQNSGTSYLNVQWERAGILRTTIPPANLFHSTGTSPVMRSYKKTDGLTTIKQYNGSFVISIAESDKHSVSICNLLGQQVWSTSGKEARIYRTTDMALGKGTYVIRVRIKNMQFVKTVFVYN